ncbi:MAG: glycosyltransferase [Chitinivibrionales bacterium]|nr:glycosyltransferase [Chitinivibrionales bacterium]
MNILMMTNTYLPFVGGVERSIQTFSDEYRSRGHRTVIVAPTFENMPKKEKDVVRVPAVQHFNGTDFSVQVPIPGVLNAALEGFEPDIVHTHHPYLIGDTALRVAARHAVPVVFTHHTFHERYTHYVPGDSPALKRFVTSLATGYANLCDRVIAPSHGVAETLHARGVKRPITVIPSGIDIDAFGTGDGNRFRKRYEIPPDAFLLGTVSRLAPEKNVPFLAEAAMRFLADGDGRFFAAVGTGPSEKEIDEAARKAGVADRVIRTGTLENQDLVDAYHALDLFLFASQTETQGMVLTEAMAAGTPVASLRAVGVNDIVVHDRNGLLLDDGNPDDLRVVMEHYLSLPVERKRQFAEQARSTAKSYDRSVCAEKAIELYAEAVEDGRAHHALEESPWDQARRRIQTELHLLGNFASATVSAMDTDQDTNPTVRQ